MSVPTIAAGAVSCAAGGVGYFIRYLAVRRDRREAALTKREQDWVEQVEARLARVERAYGIVVGVVHVIVDDLEADHASLSSISMLLKEAYPVTTEMPEELLTLAARIDLKERKRAMRASR